MTEENIKSRMLIILLMHGHHSHSLAQWVGMSWKKYTHSLNVKEVGVLEVLGSIALGWRGEWSPATRSTVSSCSHAQNEVKSVMENGVKGVKGLWGEAEGTHAKYRPQRRVGMLGGKTKAHPSLLPWSNLYVCTEEYWKQLVGMGLCPVCSKCRHKTCAASACWRRIKPKLFDPPTC